MKLALHLVVALCAALLVTMRSWDSYVPPNRSKFAAALKAVAYPWGLVVLAIEVSFAILGIWDAAETIPCLLLYASIGVLGAVAVGLHHWQTTMHGTRPET